LIISTTATGETREKEKNSLAKAYGTQPPVARFANLLLSTNRGKKENWRGGKTQRGKKKLNGDKGRLFLEKISMAGGIQNY